MMLAFTAFELGTLITTMSTAIVAIIVAFRQQGGRTEISKVHEAVKTSDGRTIGEMVEKSEKRDIANDATNGV